MHIMLDIETWGKRPGCDIRSIGACVFDPATGEISIPCQTCKGGTTRGNVNDGGDCSDCLNTRMQSGYGDTFYIATDNPDVTIRHNNGEPLGYLVAPNQYRRYNLIRDPETVKWWNDQSEESQAAFADPVDLREALRRFIVWYDNTTRINDDLTEKSWTRQHVRLWSHGPSFDPPILAEAFHACGLPVPWHYRAPRDTRQCFDMAGIDDHSTWLQQHPGPLGIWHHALDDAISQARAVCAAYERSRDRERQAFYDGWYARDIAVPSINAVPLTIHSAWAERQQFGPVQVIDLDQEFWKQIKEAVSASPWIPKEYMMNDWISDVCGFLRTMPKDNNR